MIFSSKQLIIPDYCCSCGEIGRTLCEHCRTDIITENSRTCPACLGLQRRDGECGNCTLPYSHAWYVGERRGSLDKLVSVSKFGSSRDGCDMQAELLDDILPGLPENTVIVPVPTIARHVRVRGYGHAERVARVLAQRRNVVSREIVGRAVQYVQHGATRSERRHQAEESYMLRADVDSSATYLLVDDVFTTGFTMLYIAQLLLDAGAYDIWVAVTTRQPIDSDV